MVAKVPYSPGQSVDKSQQATPGMASNAPPDAFGSGIAREIGDLGNQITRSADQLFSRAAAMQELANQSEARDADATYTIEAGKLHAEYNSLMGQDAVNAFPAYQQKLAALREQTEGKLSNPSSKRMFDTSARGTMARSIFNGAGHAASQNRQWAVGTLEAQIDLDVKSIQDNPFDDQLFEEKLNRVRGSTSELSGLAGFEANGPQEQALAQKEVSKLWYNRVVGASRQKPFEAVQMLDTHRTEMSSEDYIRADTSVRAEARAVGSANIAEEVYAPDRPFDEMEEEARAKAKKLNPEDPILEKNAVASLKGLYKEKQYITQQQQANDRTAVREGILSGVKNEQELRADPKVASAVDRLPASDRLALPSQINRYNDARDKETEQDNYLELWGLSNNDVEGFLNRDITKEKLSQPDMRKLMEKQAKIKDEKGGDPRVSRSIGWLKTSMGAQLQALGVYNRTAENAEDYDKYTGALQSALDIWADVNGKSPTYQDVVQEIGPRVVQQRAEPHLMGLWNSNRAFFDQDIPSSVADRIKADVVAKGGAEPSDEQVYKAYVRAQYFKLYGPKKDQSRLSSGKPVE